MKQSFWSRSNQSTAAMGHVCNCVGCCRECGMCSTDPRHTPDMCAKVADWKALNPLHLAVPNE